MERREVLKRYCGRQNKATLLKEARKDRTVIHAAGAVHRGLDPCQFPINNALPIPTQNLCEGIPLPIFQFWCEKFNTQMVRGSTALRSKGVIPCSCNLALGGASWYLCVLGLYATTAFQEWGLARGCPPRLRRRRLPAVSKIGEGSLTRFFLI